MSTGFGNNDARDQVRQAINIVDLVGSYLELRRQGRNYVALCPWHDDSRPSLQVNPDRQSWKCWVCNIGGDVFSFVMQREGIGFREALTMLAERAGIQLRATREQHIEPGSARDKNTLFGAVAWAEKLFHECLLNSPDAELARRYIAERGFTPETVRSWRLGFSPDSWNWLLDRARTTPYTVEVLEAIGLVGRSSQSDRPYDRFKGRVIFPIRDVQRRPIAFGGRVLPELAKEDQAKYINSPETRLFSKSDTLYGLDQARDVVAKSRRLMVMEGYTDVIVAHQCGLKEAVAVLGTALNERHLKTLKRFADRILLILDGDEAGQRRTNELLQLFVSEQVDLQILTLPEEFDPAEFLLERGGEEFEKLLATAIDALEHKFRVATQGINILRETHKAGAALDEILATIAQAPRVGEGAVQLQKLREETMFSRLARLFSVPEAQLRERMRELRGKEKKKIASAPISADLPLDSAECEVLELLALSPELAASAAEILPPESLSEGPVQEIYRRFCDLAAAGEEASFTRVLTELDDPRLKNVLVRCDDEAQQKAQAAEAAQVSVRFTPRQQFLQIAEKLRERNGAHERVARQTALEQSHLTEEEKIKLWLQTLEQRQNRQGTSAPTDG